MSQHGSFNFSAACQLANHLLIHPKPIILAFIFLVGGLGFPATSKADLKESSKYSKEEIHRAVTMYAKRYHLEPALLQAIIKVESNFRLGCHLSARRRRSHAAHAAHGGQTTGGEHS
jgi:hypothetical protein